MLPCRVIYFNERFYLKCINTEDGSIRTYRIDRMQKITAGEKTTRCGTLPQQQGALLDMYEPDCYEDVRLRVRRELLDDMLEQLGQYAGVRKDDTDEAYVIVRAKVGISYGFYRWVMKYGDTVEILSPEYVRRTFAQKINDVCKMYSDIL